MKQQKKGQLMFTCLVPGFVKIILRLNIEVIIDPFVLSPIEI
jgi:hypothetical protein